MTILHLEKMESGKPDKMGTLTTFGFASPKSARKSTDRGLDDSNGSAGNSQKSDVSAKSAAFTRCFKNDRL